MKTCRIVTLLDKLLISSFAPHLRISEDGISEKPKDLEFKAPWFQMKETEIMANTVSRKHTPRHDLMDHRSRCELAFVSTKIRARK